VTIKNAVFWDVSPCRSCVNRRFSGNYRLHLQVRRIRERGISVRMWLQIYFIANRLPISLCLPIWWPQVSMRLGSPAILDTIFLSFPVSSSKRCESSQVPSCYYVLILQSILLKFMKFNPAAIKLWLYRNLFGHYATSRKVAGSSPDEVYFFNLPNPSSRTMALGSTHPLTEMSTRNLPGGGAKERPARKADNLTATCEPIV
jgi:hypothetical protein